jgi:hypothetical protein
VRPEEPIVSQRGHGGAATQLFRVPTNQPPAKGPEPNAGPSEFTRVIAMPNPAAQAAAKPAEAAQPVQTGQAVAVAVPNVSVNPGHVSMPSMSAPSFHGPSVSGSSLSGPSFSAPSVNPGSFSAPSVSSPSLSSPSVSGSSIPATLTRSPSAGQVAVPRSLLYMILIMNALFVAALVVVMYFAFAR